MRSVRLVAPALLALAAGGACWLLRPNASQVDPRLALESWDIVADGEHNSNTDLIWWRDAFLLVHAASPYHLGTPRSRLLVFAAAGVTGARLPTMARVRATAATTRPMTGSTVSERGEAGWGIGRP